MLRPGGRRRRRRQSGLRRGLRWLPLVVVVAVVVGLAAGSLAAVRTRSAAYYRSTDKAYAALATTLVQESNSTGAALASLVTAAPTLPNGTVTARDRIQQGLDDAVATADAQARQARAIASPPPSDSVAARFSAVMAERAAAVERLRTVVDEQLGMTPLPVPGAPETAGVAQPAPLISTDAASSGMGQVGSALAQADAGYRSLLADIRHHGYPIRLPASVWVPSPQSSAPLGAAPLAATPPALAASAALVPFHHLIVSAVGLEPPAVPSAGASGAGPGSLGTSCSATAANVPPSAPTVLPPTSAITVRATVTNCGTVVEPGVPVTATVSAGDPPGTAPPPGGVGGGRSKRAVTLRAGGSASLVFDPIRVASGHQYVVTVAVTIPPAQSAQLPGATQQYVVDVTA